ncbi:ribosomal protein S8e/ribosomal biogenesis NSA2, partial [Mycena olivaceomarginata]
PQNEYIEEHIKRHGRRLDYFERKRKREARAVHRDSAFAQKAFGIKAKILHAKRHAEKVQLKKTLKAHDERNVKQADSSAVPDGALPTSGKDKAAKYAVPLPKVRGIAEDEMFKVMKTGKSKSKAWKRMVTKATFVGEGFTRKPVKMERFIRPMALRYKKANVTASLHLAAADLKATFQLQILGVKKNPQSPMYTQLGVMTKGTVIEVNVSELGMVTTGGKVVFGKYAQITNNPENDGCINAVLRNLVTMSEKADKQHFAYFSKASVAPPASYFPTLSSERMVYELRLSSSGGSCRTEDE